MVKIILTYFNYDNWLVEVDSIAGVTVDTIGGDEIWLLMYWLDRMTYLLVMVLISYVILKKMFKLNLFGFLRKGDKK